MSTMTMKPEKCEGCFANNCNAAIAFLNDEPKLLDSAKACLLKHKRVQ